ncbi:hypothetical protein PILCRDRAFT_7489 [Piloderma croceum F 1598]|uniref:Uncharacterized protein n=1 Tax=Piloderma croceum (strain F 1598) TaxID=765440 RepID=A0A0C3B9U2_PILCF|nr:hypothetical protein PILCRDRAFT_7489 [Piloderma croceum F 1598]
MRNISSSHLTNKISSLSSLDRNLNNGRHTPNILKPTNNAPKLFTLARNSLAPIKCAPTLDPLSPLATQLHILNLFGGDETPYKSLYAVVSSGIELRFNAFVGTRGRGGWEMRIVRWVYPNDQDKIAELRVFHLHLQQNVEIPETCLLIHPTIQRVALAANTRPFLSHIHPNSILLNALYAHGNSAIQEYQTQLDDSVKKKDIKCLHDKFKPQYRFFEAYHMPRCAIYHLYQRVEDVLGKGLELYAEGQKLQSESAAFRKKLDTRPVYDVSILQDKTNSVIDLYKDILRAVEDLATCPYTSEAFSELLAKIQAAIDLLNLEGALCTSSKVWCAEFDRRRRGYATGCADSRDIQQTKGDKRLKEENLLEGNMTLKPTVHEICIQNQFIFLDPPIEYARLTWIHQLHGWLGIACRLHRIQSFRYEIGLQMQGAAVVETSYISLLTHFSDNALKRPFSVIEIKVQHLRDYVAKWLQFQSLWDLEAKYVFNRLGEDLTLATTPVRNPTPQTLRRQMVPISIPLGP